MKGTFLLTLLGCSISTVRTDGFISGLLTDRRSDGLPKQLSAPTRSLLKNLLWSTFLCSSSQSRSTLLFWVGITEIPFLQDV